MELASKRKLVNAFDKHFVYRVLKLAKLFCSKQNKKNLGTEIDLFFQCTEMGAMILAAPLICKYVELNSERRHVLVTFLDKKEVCHHLFGKTSIEFVFIDPSDPLKILVSTYRVLKYLRKLKISRSFDLEINYNTSKLLLLLMGAKSVYGLKTALKDQQIYENDVWYSDYLHITENYFHLIFRSENKFQYLKINNITWPTDKVPVTYDLYFKVTQLIGRPISNDSKILTVNPGTGPTLSQRAWPLDYFSELINELLCENKFDFIFIVGHKADQRLEKILLHQLSKYERKIVGLSGRTTFEQIVDILNVSTTILTNDCGLGHLAAFVQAKTIILWGPEDNAKFSPKGIEKLSNLNLKMTCSPCLTPLKYKETSCQNNLCLKGISVLQVKEEILNERRDGFLWPVSLADSRFFSTSYDVDSKQVCFAEKVKTL